MEDRSHMAGELMLQFAGETCLSPEKPEPRRYLWTDAFAVCNFLGLYRCTHEEKYKELALLLVDQVHSTLGRHRDDTNRKGWISGLDEIEGPRHPTIGGLRIGKTLGERKPWERLDEDLEWDRDGQYYHYLTQWMHALNCVSLVTEDPIFSRWATELAKTAHARFVYQPLSGRPKLMYWKMSVDLSYPLVSSMGHHDPLDGFLTYSELSATAKFLSHSQASDLEEEIADMAAICEEKDWITDDPLGIGGLLIGTYKLGTLIASHSFIKPDLLETVLNDSLMSLNYFARKSLLKVPLHHRLAFREFGLSIGLQAIESLEHLIAKHSEEFTKPDIPGSIRRIMEYVYLVEEINSFWIEHGNRESETWKEHREINMVMLATSLNPEGYLCEDRDS